MRPWKRRLVVAAVLFAILGAAGLLLLRIRGLAPGYVELRTFTDDASGLMDGTQVRLQGIAIGYLETQKLTNSLDPMRKVELVLKVKESYLDKIPEDSVCGLASDNLLGDQYIAIRRGESGRPIVAGAELRTTQAQDISKMMARMGQEMDRLQAVAVRVDKLVAEMLKGNGSLARIINDPNLKNAAIMPEFDALMADIQHGNGTLTKLLYDDPLSAQMQSPKKRLDDVLATAGHRVDEFKGLTTELDGAMRDFKALQAEMTAGKGSLGRLKELQAHVDALNVKWRAMMDRMTEGRGTMGQFLVNPQLSDALNAATRDLQELVKGLSTNPRKFVAFRVF